MGGWVESQIYSEIPPSRLPFPSVVLDTKKVLRLHLSAIIVCGQSVRDQPKLVLNQPEACGRVRFHFS